MPQFAANLSMMFTEHPFLERFAAAAESGFTAVEYLFPYEHTPTQVAEALTSAGLTQALFNAPPGDWDRGERGIAALPGRDAEFSASLRKALDYAEALGCGHIHVMAGIAEPSETSTETYMRRIREAAETAHAQGVKILVEPINPIDMPGYFLSSVSQGLQLLKDIDHPNTGLQFDLYHAQITDGDVTRLLRSAAEVTSHIQIASVPQRHEPDQGELNYPWLFDLLDAEGYQGYIGCEYRPRAGTLEGLSWFQQYRSTQRSGA